MAKRALTDPKVLVQLQEHLHLLAKACYAFDDGDRLVAKTMSGTLRLLLDHGEHPKSTQKSLLVRLGLRGGSWLDTTRPVGGDDLPSFFTPVATGWPPLVGVQADTSGTTFFPKVYGPDKMLRRTPFPEWWARPIYEGHGGIGVCRKDMVKGMADHEGVHVDQSISERYDGLKSGSLHYAKFGSVTEGGSPLPGAAHACIRVIAHETLRTLFRVAPHAFVTSYRYRTADGGEFFIPTPK